MSGPPGPPPNACESLHSRMNAVRPDISMARGDRAVFNDAENMESILHL